MDVSYRFKKSDEQASPDRSSGGTDVPQGEALINSIVSLSGLPETAVREEIADILKQGDSSEADLSSLSLDQLRHAMLVYLESIHADMISKETDCAQLIP